MRGPSKGKPGGDDEGQLRWGRKSTCEGGVGAGGWRFQKSVGLEEQGVGASGTLVLIRGSGLWVYRPPQKCAILREPSGGRKPRKTNRRLRPVTWVQGPAGGSLVGEADLGGGVNPAHVA